MSRVEADVHTIVQLESLLLNVGGCEEIALMVVEEFLLQVDAQVADIKTALDAADCAQIRAAAHRHAGSLAAIYAGTAHALAKGIELAAKEQDLARARSLFAQLSVAENELAACLERWCATRRAH